MINKLFYINFLEYEDDISTSVCDDNSDVQIVQDESAGKTLI